MDISIGGRKQLGVAVLQIPAGDDAWVEFDADDWHVKLHLLFVDDPEKGENTFSLDPQDDHAVLMFSNWSHSLPGTTGQPMAFGETNGKKVSLLISGFAIEKFKSLTLSFFWEN